MKATSPELAGTNPAELRSMFGANLRHLCKGAPSIAALCRDLGVNRTQFNRYLSGESFPRPDVLHRICAFFDVDARILLEPVETIRTDGGDILRHPQIAEFLGGSARPIPPDVLAGGLYRFSRASFTDESRFVQGLVLIYRRDGQTFLRGKEPVVALRDQGLPADPQSREFRGVLLPQEGGVAALVARRGSVTFSFNYLARAHSYENNYWVGYAIRTTAETLTGRRVTRMVYEHLGRNRPEIRRAARAAGMCGEKELLPYHRRLLMADKPFR